MGGSGVVSACREAAAILKAGRTLLREGLVLGTAGNISARRRDGSILITPSGVPYPSLRPQDLVLLNERGERLEGKLRPSSEVLLHTSIYRARPDVNGIVHTHSPYASVFAVNRQAIPPVLDEFVQLVGAAVEVADYAPPGSPRLAAAAMAALKDRKAVLLASHGLVGVGGSLPEAMLICQVVEKAARVYLLAKLSGVPYVFREAEIEEIQRRYFRTYGQKEGKGEDEDLD